jgi:hypothetical protein
MGAVAEMWIVEGWEEAGLVVVRVFQSLGMKAFRRTVWMLKAWVWFRMRRVREGFLTVLGVSWLGVCYAIGWRYGGREEGKRERTVDTWNSVSYTLTRIS